jgi:type IV fimbrial biogenesis protein FimT
MKNQHATTLIELLIALSMLAMLTIAAVPGLTSLIQKIRMDNDVNGLIHSFHRARQNALVSGIPTPVCCSSSGNQCDIGCDWADGWLVFANADGDEPPVIDPGESVLESGRLSANLRIQANRQAYIMRPFGLRSTNGTLTFCDARGTSHARAVIVSYTGKPRVSNTSASGKPLVCNGIAQ